MCTGRVRHRTISGMRTYSMYVVRVGHYSAAPHINHPTTRKAWRYSSADWGRLRHFFGTTDRSAVINDNPNHSCLKTTQCIIQGMEKFIPSKFLTTLPSDPPPPPPTMVVTRVHASNGGQGQSLEGLEK